MRKLGTNEFENEMIDQPYEKKIPSGPWMLLTDLPANVSDTEVSEYLHSCGLAIPIEYISVRHYPFGTDKPGASAKVCVPREVVTD